MSRPAQPENNFASNRRSVIDFVGAPMPINTALYPADDMYMQANYAPMPPGVYTMSGYPSGPGQSTSAYVQAAYPVPLTAVPQGYTAAYAASPYCAAYPVSAAATLPDTAQRGVAASQPTITEETLQQKVDSKIDAIMNAHKTDMLSQQISRLTEKVQKLSNNIEIQKSERTSLPSTSNFTDSGEGEMSRRLRKLAEESGRRASSESRATPLF